MPVKESRQLGRPLKLKSLKIGIKAGNPPGGRRVAHQRGAAGQVVVVTGGTGERIGFLGGTAARGKAHRTGTQQVIGARTDTPRGFKVGRSSFFLFQTRARFVPTFGDRKAEGRWFALTLFI